MTSDEPPEEDRQRQGDEDTEAILSRRRFLIFSTLAGAGVGAALSGCRPEPPQPKACFTSSTWQGPGPPPELRSSQEVRPPKPPEPKPSPEAKASPEPRP